MFRSCMSSSSIRRTIPSLGRRPAFPLRHVSLSQSTRFSQHLAPSAPASAEQQQQHQHHNQQQIRFLSTKRPKGSRKKYVPPPEPSSAVLKGEETANNKDSHTNEMDDDGDGEKILWSADAQAHKASELVRNEKKLLLPTTDLSQFVATPSLLSDTPYTTLGDLQKGAAAEQERDDAKNYAQGSNKEGTAASRAELGDTIPTPQSTLSMVSDLGGLRDLYDPSLHLSATAPTDWRDYEPATPLWEEMAAWIGVAGRPISVADYMRLCNTHPAYGYYTQASSTSSSKPGSSNNNNNNDDFDDDDWDVPTDNDSNTSSNEAAATAEQDNLIIGPGGDFVTAPEMSQIFGECLAVWCMTLWQLSTSRPTSWQWLEVGPGRGSLMVDLIRFGVSVPKIRDTFGNGCRGIHLIETSPRLRQVQRETLMAQAGHLVHFEFPQDGADESKDSPKTTETDKLTIPVYWHDTLASFSFWQKENESYLATFAICQEFLDALPVYSFEKTDEGWRERLVDIAMRDDIDLEEFDDKAAAAAAARKKANDASLERLKDKKKPRLRLVIAPEVTPAAKTLLQVDGETGLMPNENPPAPVGSVMEVNPEGILFVQELARIIDKQGGGALVIDYGQEGSSDSIRAFARHEQVHFLSRPGQVDVTADVDFAALKHCVNAMEMQRGTQAFGPVRQGDFLMSMGAQDRAIHLIENENTSEEDAENIYQALVRLCDPAEMGERFKVLAIAAKKDGIFQPPGF